MNQSESARASCCKCAAMLAATRAADSFTESPARWAWGTVLILRHTHAGDAEAEATQERIGQSVALPMAGESPVVEGERGSQGQQAFPGRSAAGLRPLRTVR